MSIQKISSEDNFINELLTGWVKANLHYIELLGKKDCSWWYNERANVSVLAGTAWSLGWTAIEEYPSYKIKGIPEVDIINTEHSKGRVDLYISSRDQDIAVEAKHIWYDLDTVGEINTTTIKNGMSNARNDANRLVDQAQRHFSATFIVFHTKTNPNGFISDSKVENIINRGMGNKNHKSISYAYLITNSNESVFKNNFGFYYPGVALILEQIN